MDLTCDLTCKYCGKTAKSRSGLTNHEKTCSKRPIVDDPTFPDNDDLNNLEPIQESAQDRKPFKTNSNPFQFGAFLVMVDYVPILLDVDFCIALGNYILEHGSSNSAIMAFAHHLNKLEGD